MSVELKQVDFAYGAGYAPEAFPLALDGVSVRVDDGEFVGIMGKTGCGKSTFLQLVAGLLTPLAGQVLIDGRDINAKGYDRAMLRRSVGLVFQYPEMQLFEQTVEKDVSFGLKQAGLSMTERRERVDWALSCMGFEPSAVRDKHPLGLSGGERRRVAIAGVLAVRPSLLMLDEPVAGLDPAGRRALMGLLDSLNAEGTTILMASHNADCLADHARRIIVFDGGRVFSEGAPQEVFADAQGLERLGVGVSHARATAAALEDAGILAGDYAGASSYDRLLDALVARFGREARL